MVQPMPYVAVQQMIDAPNPPGRLNYWNADFYSELPDEAIDTFVARATKPVSPFSQVLVMPGGGAIARVPEEATAFVQRDAQFNLHYLSSWEDPAETDRNISWTRDFSGSMKPWASGRQYLNMIGDEGVNQVESAYGRRSSRSSRSSRQVGPDEPFLPQPEHPARELRTLSAPR